MDIRKVFGLNMRRLRLAAGLSQEDAAEIIGVGRAHAGAMERGQQNVTLLILWQVAQAWSKLKPAPPVSFGPAMASASDSAVSYPSMAGITALRWFSACLLPECSGFSLILLEK